MAGTGVDEHHCLLDGFAPGTLEFHLHSFGAMRGTAPSITAHATVPGFVGMYTGAVLKLKVRWLHSLLSSVTLLPLLACLLLMFLLTWSDHAQAVLLPHLTATVPVGDPCGHPHSTRLGTGAPFRCLFNAVNAGIKDVNSIGVFLSVSCHRKTPKG